VGEGYQTNGNAKLYTWYVEAMGSSRSTSQYVLQTARSTEGSTIARWVNLAASTELTSATLQVVKFEGPYLAVRPYVTAMGSTGAAGSTGVHLEIELIAV